MADRDFKKQLERQIGFLQRSCNSYDAGYFDESIRIATIIRVLLHDTKSSTSLLKHLGASNIKLASTVADFPREKTVMLTAMGRTTLTTGPEPGQNSATWTAVTDPEHIQGALSVSEWWNQIVYVLGKARCSRKSLVLAAADKDGGAHVDAALTAEYEIMMKSAEHGFFYYSATGAAGTFQPVMNMHLVYIRQMGFELLNSPELLALMS